MQAETAPRVAPAAQTALPRLTREQIDVMDAEGLRVAVAEALGWRDVKIEPTIVDGCTERLDMPWGQHPEYLSRTYTPDYSGDIAAAFALGEETQKRGLIRQFTGHLWEIMQKDNHKGDWEVTFLCTQASPQDRCRAFLLAVHDCRFT